MLSLRLAPMMLAACAMTASGQDTTRATAAIVLFASASAREVVFARQPVISVRLAHGTVDSVRVIERRNLPERIQPGTTYRDVYVAVEILGHVRAACLTALIEGRAEARCAAPDSGRTRTP